MPMEFVDYNDINIDNIDDIKDFISTARGLMYQNHVYDNIFKLPRSGHSDSIRFYQYIKNARFTRTLASNLNLPVIKILYDSIKTTIGRVQNIPLPPQIIE